MKHIIKTVTLNEIETNLKRGTKQQTVPSIVDIVIPKKINRDIVKASNTLGRAECRYLVDLYYQIQGFRIATKNQIRSIVQSNTKEPHETITYFSNQFESIEEDIKKCLKVYVQSQPLGQWLLSITGIGPVISAGIMANLDIKKAETAGAFWRYCGLDPTIEWLGKEKARKLIEEVCGDKKKYTVQDLADLAQASNWGFDSLLSHFNTPDEKGKLTPMTKTEITKYLSRIPYNANMKKLMYLVGESFVKVQNNPSDVYGKLFVQRKAYEKAKNEKGDYANQASEKLLKYNIGKDTEAYKAYSQGKLPDAQIHARARRWTVKIFLSHLFEVWYKLEYGKEPPAPFAIDILGHAHKIKVPSMVEG